MSNVNDSSSATGSSQEGEGKRYALVVGVNKSAKVRHLPALQYAESDATSIGHLLNRRECSFAFPHPVLVGEAANAQNVSTAITDLIGGKGKNDLLLFYFIGHGYPVETDNGEFEVYLVTSDFDPHRAKINPDIYLSLRQIRKILYERQKEASVIWILDCCHAGGATESPPPEKQLVESWEAFARSIRNIEQSSAPTRRTWAILASTGKNDRARERVMTGLILDALSGDAWEALDGMGNLTLQTLHAYLQRHIGELGSGTQRPIMQGKFDKPWILANHPSKSTAPVSPNYLPPPDLKLPFDIDISSATSGDLDTEQVRTFLEKGKDKIQRDYKTGSSQPAQIQALGLLRGEYPSYGALLCFGHDPSRQIAGAYTRCIYRSDTKRLIDREDDREYRGSLLQQFTQTCDFLQHHLHFSRVIERGGSSERLEIPFRVLEEAVANALVHREYVTEPNRIVRTEGVMVEILSDRVEIKNPGNPPVALDTEHPESHSRNSLIRRIFYLAGHVESAGTGIVRMKYWMQKAGLPEPVIKQGQQTFTVILFRPARVDAGPPVPESPSRRRAPWTDLSPNHGENSGGSSHPTITAPNDKTAPTNISHNGGNQTHSQRPSQTQVLVTPPSITSRNATPNSQHSPVQSISKKNKQLVVTLCALLIVMVILASVVGGIYFVNMQAHSPIPTPAPPLGPASTTIEIASDFPTSGLETTDGPPLQNGVQMAITEANTNGLLPPGYTLKLVPYNDVGNGNRHDPQVGANNLKQAIADNLVVGLVGPGNSSVAKKELPTANQAPLALLSPSVTFPCLTKSTTDDPECSGTNDVATQMRPFTNQPTFFRLATTDDRQGKAAADLFTQHHSKVLLLKDDSDPYSFGLAQAFQTEWQHMQGQVIPVDFPQSASSVQDYQNTLQAVISTQPDLIYFAGNDPNGSYVLQALSNIATLKTVPFAGGDGIMESSLLQTAANLHRNAPIYASLPIEDPAHSGTTIGVDFAANYTNNAYDHYRPYAASAYDCTMMLIQAIKKALRNASTPHGTQDPAGAVQFRKAVLQALRDLFYTGATGTHRDLSYTGATGTHSFDGNGDTTNHTVSFYQADLSAPPPSWTWLQQVNA